MRTLVIGDIHGAFKALQQVLAKVTVTKNDLLIFLGDYVDGWSESPQVLDFLISLQKTHRCIFLRGNHDELLLDWLINKNENINQEEKHNDVYFVKKLENLKLVATRSNHLHNHLEKLTNLFL